MRKREKEDFNGVDVERTVEINRSAMDVYEFWRNLENISAIIPHIQKITVLDGKRSHWVAKGPLGIRIEWNSELTEDVPGRLLGWRSVEGSDLKSSGAVEFIQDGRQNTLVKVTLRLAFPAGRLGAALARLLGNDPGREISEGLAHLKETMEARKAA